MIAGQIHDVGNRNREEKLSETQHVHHVVQAWRLPNHPPSGTQGASCEGISVTRSMRHFDALPIPPKRIV
jgi:hypothetical protein